MDSKRLRKIIAYSRENKARIETKIKEFYSYADMDNEKDWLNLMQIARPLFKKKGYIIIELPLADKEIGALCYKGDILGYMILNTALPKVNVNFALCHEIYHVFCQETECRNKVEWYMNEHYYEYEEEHAANLFAGMLLMPEQSYRFMFRKFQNEATEQDSQLTVLVKLMSYFEVPYMAALVRCYELELLEAGKVLEILIHADEHAIREEFMRLWLDDSILNATRKDDYNNLESMVALFGTIYEQENYVGEKTLKQVLKNMKVLYDNIKGE